MRLRSTLLCFVTPRWCRKNRKEVPGPWGQSDMRARVGNQPLHEYARNARIIGLECAPRAPWEIFLKSRAVFFFGGEFARSWEWDAPALHKARAAALCLSTVSRSWVEQDVCMEGISVGARQNPVFVTNSFLRDRPWWQTPPVRRSSSG